MAHREFLHRMSFWKAVYWEFKGHNFRTVRWLDLFDLIHCGCFTENRKPPSHHYGLKATWSGLVKDCGSCGRAEEIKAKLRAGGVPGWFTLCRSGQVPSPWQLLGDKFGQLPWCLLSARNSSFGGIASHWPASYLVRFYYLIVLQSGQCCPGCLCLLLSD